MGYMDSMDESRMDTIIDVIKKLHEVSSKGGDTKPLFDKLAERMTVAEVMIIASVLTSKGTEEQVLAELDGVEQLLDIHKAIGVPLETRMSELTPAQKQAIDEGAEDAKALRRMVDRWKKANQA